MFRIEKRYDEYGEGLYDIYITRGDTGFIEIPLFDNDNEPYTPIEGDSVRFAVKKKYKDEECLVLKPIPIETLILEIKPEDTKELEFGKYVYDIEFTDSLGHVSTFIRGSFIVDKEVH